MGGGCQGRGVAGYGTCDARAPGEAAARTAQSPHGPQQGGLMSRYFFHLAGDVPAHDLLGHDCGDEAEAVDHGSFIAHRIGTERPEMIRKGNFISVVDARGNEIAQVPLASTTV